MIQTQIRTVIIFAFVFMLLYPLIMSIIKSIDSGQNDSFHINQVRVRNPRYFGSSFADIFEKGWKNYDGGGKLKLSREETVIEADYESEYPKKCYSIIYAENEDFIPSSKGVNFEKEIYACQNVCLMNVELIRAVYCKKNITIGNHAKILRWIDADGIITVFDDSDLGISISSGSEIRLGVNCIFRRLYAPVIYFGKQAGAKYYPELHYAFWDQPDDKYSEIHWDLRYVTKEHTDEDGVLLGGIITKHNLTVLEGLVVKGSIRSQKSIRICNGAKIIGNLFAERNIEIGSEVVIMGTAFTQGELSVEKNSAIGRPGFIKSAIARHAVSFQEGCRVYGYVSTEEKGISCPREMMTKEIDNEKAQMSGGFEGITKVLQAKSRTFSFLEWSRLPPGGFRNNLHLQEVFVPEGVTEIERGFFYGCRNLTKIIFPASLQIIGAFAFFQCESLADVDIAFCKITEIGESTFEGCTALQKIHFPSSLKLIGQAAFKDCVKLYDIGFEEQSALRKLESHAFMGCCAIRRLKLPKNLLSVGKSAFCGCSALEHLLIPECVEFLGDYCFYGCDAMKRLIILPRRIHKIEKIFEGLHEQVDLIAVDVNVANEYLLRKQKGEASPME